MQYRLDENILKIEISSISYHTIQDFLDVLVPSKKYQHLLIQNKWIKIDGNPVKRETIIEGNTLEIDIYPERYDCQFKTDKELNIVYEDEIFLVVNKPAKLLVHSDGNSELCLNDMVESYYYSIGLMVAPSPIHRLDYETSGMVVYVKSIILQAYIDKLLMYKHIKRNYLAIAYGKSKKGERIVVDKPIGKHRHDSKKRMVALSGQQAKTVFTCIDTNGLISAFDCELKTGRTHQIRVHLAYINHPILNDPLYGKTYKGCNQMCLCAYHLSLYHPLKEDVMELEILPDSEIRKVL